MYTDCNSRLFACIAVLSLAIAVTPASSTHAALSVSNPSFESPNISDPPISNWFAITTPIGWTAIDPSSSRRIIDGTDIQTMQLTPFNMTGEQFAILGAGFTLGDGSGQGTDLFQNIGTTDSLTNVVMSVDTARRRDVDQGGIPPGDITIGIWRDTDSNSIPDLPLATLSILAAAETDTFLPKVVTALAVPGGTELYVRLTAANSVPTFEGFRQTLIDNVQILQTGVVPEPSSLLLLGFASAFMGAFVRRGRG